MLPSRGRGTIDHARSACACDARRVERPHPLYCVWEITLACDLGCKHCGSRAGKARPEELTTAQALEVVAQLAEVGVRDCVLIGGEAYLRDSWTTIARALADRGITVGMTTGGRAT